MIVKPLRGWRPAGLIRYLFGPGKFEEHRNPRVVASWDGAPHLHHPEKFGPGEFDFELEPLTTTMQELAEDAGLPLSTPPAITPEWSERVRSGDIPANGPWWVKHYRYDKDKDVVVRRPGYVWHTPVRLHPTDRTLSDAEWETIAERLVKAAGIQQAGCRWIAVRHADDHIHLMATLVSETTGKRFHPKFDKVKMREEADRIEVELGLFTTAAADKTAKRASSRAEKGKSARLGRSETAREQLQRIVRQCAAAARNGTEFLAELADEGLDPRTTHDAAGRIRGYTVRLPGDVNAAGEPISYSGTKLAADLTWPKLMARWASTPQADVPVPRSADGRVSPADRRDVLEHSAEIADRARSAIRDDTENPEGIAHATGELLASLARSREGRELGPLTEISERYDRAARTPHRVLPDLLGPLARDLRHASRRIAAAGALTGRGNEKVAMVALVLALAGLIAEIAAWQQARGRVHQAAAARAAAGTLPSVIQSSEPGGKGTRRPAQPSTPGGVRRDRRIARPEAPLPTSDRRPRRPT